MNFLCNRWNTCLVTSTIVLVCNEVRFTSFFSVGRSLWVSDIGIQPSWVACLRYIFLKMPLSSLKTLTRNSMATGRFMFHLRLFNNICWWRIKVHDEKRNGNCFQLVFDCYSVSYTLDYIGLLRCFLGSHVAWCSRQCLKKTFDSFFGQRKCLSTRAENRKKSWFNQHCKTTKKIFYHR